MLYDTITILSMRRLLPVLLLVSFSTQDAVQTTFPLCVDISAASSREHDPSVEVVPFHGRDHQGSLPEGTSASIPMWQDGNNTLPSLLSCSLRVTTCTGCVLEVTADSAGKGLSGTQRQELSMCHPLSDAPCLQLRVVEMRADMSFEQEYSSVSLLSSLPSVTHVTTSGDALIRVEMRNLQGKNKQFVDKLFPLHIRSLPSILEVAGKNGDEPGFIESPRYPSPYPRRLEKTYRLVNREGGRVRLQWDDFRMHLHSEIQILDSDSSLLFSSSSSRRRPPALQSTGDSITVTFKANGYTHPVGFRAKYSFVSRVDEWAERPDERDCDQLIDSYGGELRLDDLRGGLDRYVDCVWIIGREDRRDRTAFDRVYLKIDSFGLRGRGVHLEVREGGASIDDRLLILSETNTPAELGYRQPRQWLGDATISDIGKPTRTHPPPITTTTAPQHGFTTGLSAPAFYIRLQGYVQENSYLSLVFAQFYRWATQQCPGLGEFHCENARCIKASLRCDGVDHCGDGSDEQCMRPNGGEYRAGEETDVAGLVALVVGVCGLIVLLIASTAAMSKFYRRRTPSEAAAAAPGQPPYESTAPQMQTVGERRFYVLPEQHVSVIEAPPCYDDALKHPQVTTDVSPMPAYSNAAFRRSSQDSNPSTPASPLPPPAFDEIDDAPPTHAPPTSSGASRSQAPPTESHERLDSSESWV